MDKTVHAGDNLSPDHAYFFPHRLHDDYDKPHDIVYQGKEIFVCRANDCGIHVVGDSYSEAGWGWSTAVPDFFG